MIPAVNKINEKRGFQMRIFSYYLPQYHEIPENNEWWGEGFTEWTNVKKANPLFKGHVQPLHPLNNNYYNLMEKETVEWQTQLMKDYGLTGMIYYHYYFCGKKLLEKPAENLLRWKDIEQPFFFCWANHSWKKTWNGSSELLVEQTYGNEKDWEDHFQYLLPFFKDRRYEKINNKPVFMLFNAFFSSKKEIVNYFNKRCKDIGFGGIYIVNTALCVKDLKINDSNSNVEEIWHLREPNASVSILMGSFKSIPSRIIRRMRKMIFSKYVYKYNGDALLKDRTNFVCGQKYIPGLFFGWDNTPRHGSRGDVITSPSKESFMKYMDSIRDSEYVFINAWNEWCEGMILEPTEENGYKYLEWIKEWTEKR